MSDRNRRDRDRDQDRQRRGGGRNDRSSAKSGKPRNSEPVSNPPKRPIILAKPDRDRDFPTLQQAQQQQQQVSQVAVDE